jgi:putative transposase
MSAVAETLGVARSNLAARAARCATATAPISTRLGRPPAPEEELLVQIRDAIGDLPTYGYRRVHAILRRQARADGLPAPNHKRVYHVMRAHGLLLARHSGRSDERRHDGRIAVDRSNLRWCSDAFEVGCDDGGRVRVAFALDCCDREALGFVGTTEGIKAEDVQDLMIAAVEARFGPLNRLPHTIEWLSDNGSGYIAGNTKASPARSASSRAPRRSAHQRATALRSRSLEPVAFPLTLREDHQARLRSYLSHP